MCSCSDKTGTLTRNEMTVVSPVVLDGHDERELSSLPQLASRLENQDLIELPIFHSSGRTPGGHRPDRLPARRSSGASTDRRSARAVEHDGLVPPDEGAPWSSSAWPRSTKPR